MATPPNAQVLPPKEMSSFKKLIKLYDSKQFKNGLRIANSILANPKFSEHGETLAMKAILLNSIGKHEEANDYIKRGLKANISSFVCWHIYGLIRKGEHKYDEAIKCFLQALRLDKQNIQVLRDLSALQLQLRSYEAARETRLQLLKLRPGMKNSWFGYAVTLHLNGLHDQAVRLLDEYLKSVVPNANDSSTSSVELTYETSEVILYQVVLLMESAKYEEALACLEKNHSKIVDIASSLEYKTKILGHLDRTEEASNLAWELCERNPECVDYYQLLIRAKRQQSAGKLSDLDILEEALVKSPKSRALKRLMLPMYSIGDVNAFASKLDDFLRWHLRKGVPALFELIRPLYDEKPRVEIIAQLIHAYGENLKKRQTLGPVLGLDKAEDDQQVEPPTTQVWLDYLHARHLNHLNQQPQALSLLKQAMLKTPTLVDLYVLTADCHARMGDYIRASRWSEEAQSLDTADRYLNALATQAMLKAHRLKEAEQMASQFTHGRSSAVEYLSEMQCMWFLQETAQAYWQQGEYGKALKFCQIVNRHFDAILDDQLDFHAYSLRKATLRSYVKTLRLGDRLRSHHAFFDTARIAIFIYIHLHEHASEGEAKENQANLQEKGAGEHMTEEELAEEKRRKTKERKAARKAEAEAERLRVEREKHDRALKAKHQEANNDNKDKDGDKEKPSVGLDDPSLDPQKLLKPECALDEAMKFVTPLVEEFSQKIESHCMAFEVYARRNRVFLMFAAVKRGLSLPKAQQHPWLHECVVRFLLRMRQMDQNGPSEQDQLAWAVLKEQMEQWFPGPPDPREYNEKFLRAYPRQYLCQLHAHFCKFHLKSEPRDSLIRSMPVLDSSNANWENLTWQDAFYAWDAMFSMRDVPEIGAYPSEFLERFRASCQARFPLATVFLTQKEQQKLRDDLAVEVKNAKTFENSSAFLGLFTSASDDQPLAAQIKKLQINGNVTDK